MEIIKIVNARKVLEGLSDREDICSHLSYWMTKFIAKTESEYDFYVTEMRKLIEKYATQNDDGTIAIASENVATFNEMVNALNGTDVEAPDIKFNLSELSSELKLSMKQMYPLLDFINEEK